MKTEISRDEITNLIFLGNYMSNYRYHKDSILNYDYKNLKEIFPDLIDEQIDNLQFLIEIEIVINIIQYCIDLATIIISLGEPKKAIKKIASLHETGSGSIEEFYQKVSLFNEKEIKELMGYNKITHNHSTQRIKRSCERFQEDLKKISVFYKQYYVLFTEYKHGLGFIAIREKGGRKVIMEATRNNDLDITVYHTEMWWINSIEILDIINQIFEKLYRPLIKKIVSEKFGIDFTKESEKKRIASLEEVDPTRPIKRALNFEMPWWIHDQIEPRPFY